MIFSSINYVNNQRFVSIYIYIYIFEENVGPHLWKYFIFMGNLTHVLPALLKIQAALCLRDRTSNKRPENFRESR